MRQWGEKIKVRTKGREDHQIRSEPKPLQPIWTLIQTPTIQTEYHNSKTPKCGQICIFHKEANDFTCVQRGLL